MNKPILIEARGRSWSLNAWARENDCDPSTVAYRYRNGIRDPEKLVSATRQMKERRETPEDLTAEQIHYLLTVAKYSEGQEDHWEILADFAGVEHRYIPWLKKQLEGAI